MQATEQRSYSGAVDDNASTYVKRRTKHLLNGETIAWIVMSVVMAYLFVAALIGVLTR